MYFFLQFIQRLATTGLEVSPLKKITDGEVRRRGRGSHKMSQNFEMGRLGNFDYEHHNPDLIFHLLYFKMFLTHVFNQLTFYRFLIVF